MLVTKKETYKAAYFNGTMDAVAKILDTFPNIVLKVYRDEGKLQVEVRLRSYAADYFPIETGEYVLLDGGEFSVWTSDAFWSNFAKADEDVWVAPDDPSAVW